MDHSEEELYSAIRKFAADRGVAHALRVVLEWAKAEERHRETTEFRNSYRICSNLIEAAATQVADL